MTTDTAPGPSPTQIMISAWAKSPKPWYRIAAALVRDITDGTIPPGSELPADDELAAQFRTVPAWAAKAKRIIGPGPFSTGHAAQDHTGRWTAAAR